jgi:hypothetical protein
MMGMTLARHPKPDDGDETDMSSGALSEHLTLDALLDVLHLLSELCLLLSGQLAHNGA